MLFLLKEVWLESELFSLSLVLPQGSLVQDDSLVVISVFSFT